MMRSLYTASSGMIGQQFNVDVISNNLANVNTVGYKKQRAEFKDLFYETLNRAQIMEGEGRPVNLQVGHGSTPFATVTSFNMGNFEKTDNALDFAIDGDAFFVIRGRNDVSHYTRDGSFKISISPEGRKLSTSDGYSVLDETGNDIILDIDINRLNVGPDGALSYLDANGAPVDLGQKIGLVKFPNRQGLENAGGNLYSPTAASGEAFPDNQEGSLSTINQRFLESSNVQVVEEMVKLIVAQRAYEINSKAIQSSDEMLGMANSLRRG
jgi:flagellar basal-body rod protein FlgG